MKLIHSSFAFVLTYVLLMIPTYVLPYFGSNSSIAQSISHSAGLGFLPQWWIHVWFLSALVLVSWMRGKWTDKGSLPAFSVAAGLFDILPVLSFIPFIPTIFHIVTIFIGANSKSVEFDETDLKKESKKALKYGLMISSICCMGILIFGISSSKSKHEVTEVSQTETYIADPTDIQKSSKDVTSINNLDDKDLKGKKKTNKLYMIPFSEGQVWRGDYVCAQGNTPMSIEISNVKEIIKDKYEVKAIFNFGDETHTAGSYKLAGEFDNQTGKILFTPLEWISQPSGYVAVGLKVLEIQGNSIKGKMQHSSCTTFQATL